MVEAFKLRVRKGTFYDCWYVDYLVDVGGKVLALTANGYRGFVTWKEAVDFANRKANESFPEDYKNLQRLYRSW